MRQTLVKSREQFADSVKNVVQTSSPAKCLLCYCDHASPARGLIDVRLLMCRWSPKAAPATARPAARGVAFARDRPANRNIPVFAHMQRPPVNEQLIFEIVTVLLSRNAYVAHHPAW
jgi:hypothetical protein